MGWTPAPPRGFSGQREKEGISERALGVSGQEMLTHVVLGSQSWAAGTQEAGKATYFAHGSIVLPQRVAPGLCGRRRGTATGPGGQAEPAASPGRVTLGQSLGKDPVHIWWKLLSVHTFRLASLTE